MADDIVGYAGPEMVKLREEVRVLVENIDLLKLTPSEDDEQ